MEEDYDVIIVGASIHGLCMANYLAGKGLKILIVDLKSIKRIGEGVTGTLITESSVLFLKNAFNIRIPANFMINEFSSIKIGSIDGAGFDISSKFYIVDKKLFSAYLMGKIIELENVEVLERHLITDLFEEERSFKGVIIKNMARGNTRQVSAKVIVDASGSTAVIRRKIQNNRFFIKDIEDFDRAVIYDEVLEYNELPSKPALYFDPSNLGAGHIMVMPEKNNLLISMGVSGKREIERKAFNDYKARLINVKESKVVISNSGITPIRRALNSFVYKNVMLVGNSACQVNPIFPEDTGFGLKGTYFACKAILSAFSKNVFSTESLWEYNVNYMRECGSRGALLECVRDFFASLSTETFDFIIRNNIVPASLVENLEARIKKRDILFNNARVLLKPRLMHKLIKLTDYTRKMKELYKHYPEYDDFERWKKKLFKELRSIRKSFLV